MKIQNIQIGDVLVDTNKHGSAFFRVVRVNRVTVDVIGEDGVTRRVYAHLFDRKIPDPKEWQQAFDAISTT